MVLSLLSLGVVVGFSPTLFAVVLRLLARGGSAIRQVAFVCAGMLVAVGVLLLVFRSVDPQTFIDVWTGRVEAALVRRAVDLAAALVLLAAAAVVWRLYRRRPHRPTKRTPRQRGSRPIDLAAIGFANTLISVSSIATTYVTGRVIAGFSPHWGWRLASLAVFAVAVVGPYLLLAVLWDRVPAIARTATRIEAWVGRQDFRPLIAGALAVTGVVFVGLGIAGA